jgi:hypothetical protein
MPSTGVAAGFAALIALRIAQPIRLGIQQPARRCCHSHRIGVVSSRANSRPSVRSHVLRNGYCIEVQFGIVEIGTVVSVMAAPFLLSWLR